MNNQTPTISPARNGWIYFLLILVFGMMVYREALIPGNVLFTTDDSLGAMSMRKSMFPHAFLGGWYDITAAGVPMFTPINATNLFLTLMSPQAFMNWIHTIDLVVGSWFLMMFLRLRGVGWMGAALGALLTFWFGSTFFLTYAGHIGKFGAVMFAGIYLYCVERAIRDRSWMFAILAGSAMAGMFTEQQDSALFFSMVLGPYALFRGWQSYKFNVIAHAKVIAPMLVIAAAVAFHSVYSAYSFYRMDIPADGNEQSKQDLWDYCTQWSWPPLETVEFFAPGYMGWRSGEPSGPYWGALGRSPQWQPQYGPNGMNFKLETFYKGFLPLMFMIMGIYVVLIRRRSEKDERQQFIFWSAALVVTFILSCGKYTPLYRLFFELPGMSSIRNPVKFMQITQFAMGIMAAYGLDYWLKQMQRGVVKNDMDRPVITSFTRGIFYAAILISAFALVLAVKFSGSVSAFSAEGWQTMAPQIVKVRLHAVIHLAVMAWIGYGLLTLGASGGKVKYSSWRHLGWAVLVVVMVDQLFVSRHYVNAVKVESLVSKGDLVPMLERELGQKRAYLWSPPQNFNTQWQGLYNQWQTILFPNYQIPTVNMISMRLPEDYEKYFAVMGSQPVKMWQQMALGLSLTPADFWTQIRNDPSLRGAFEPVVGFNVIPAGSTGVTTIRTSGQQPAQHVLLRMMKPSDRFALIAAWEVAELDEALKSMTTLEPLTKVMISPDVSSDWPVSGEPGRTGNVEVKSYRDGRVELAVSTDQPAVLRAADKFAPDWKATVDGEEVPVHRCDGIFMGILIKPSAQPQHVVLEFRPQRQTLYLQLAGLGITGLALVGSFFVRRKDAAQNA